MDTFSAVADPTRRAMLDLLMKGERPAGDLVSAFPGISQPAVSKHLKVLREAGLVNMQVRAQQRIYSLKPEALAGLNSCVAKYKVLWPERLDALEEHLSKNDKIKHEQKNDTRNETVTIEDGYATFLKSATFPAPARGSEEGHNRPKRARISG